MFDELRINPDFEKVIPPLSDDEFQQLEANILAEGEAYTPIFTWNGFIVDGHNRYRIIQKHPEIVFRVREREFNNSYEVMSWICDTQLGRRNLTFTQRKVLIGRRYEAEKMSHGGQERFSGSKKDDSPSGPRGHLEDMYKTTREKLAKEMGVSPRTVARAAEFTRGLDAAEEVAPGFEREVLSGAINPTQKEIIAIAKAPPDERQELIRELRLPKEGKKERRRQRELMRDIRAVSAEMRKGGKSPPTTGELLEWVVLDINTAISIFESNLSKCQDAFTDKRYKVRLDRIIGILEQYTQKLRGEQNYD